MPCGRPVWFPADIKENRSRSLSLSAEFRCAHGNRCINPEQVCDGQNDCQDRSDEMDCQRLTEGCHRRCDNNTRCIPDTFLCDGEKDCADGSDEEKCGERCQIFKPTIYFKVEGDITASFQAWWRVGLTSTAVRAVSVCLRASDVMDMLTAVTTPMRRIARDPRDARCSSSVPTATSVCRESGSATARTTAKTGRTRR